MQQSKTGAKLGLAVAAVLLVAVAGLVAFGGGESDAGAAAAAPAGPPAPDVELVYLDGGISTLAALQGRPVVLNFFADWCPACVAEMPDFEAVHQQFGDDVRFIGLDRSGSDGGARGIIESTGITYDVALDRDGSIFQAFGGLAMPTTVFIAADGSVVGQHNGVIFAEDLSYEINELFFDN